MPIITGLFDKDQLYVTLLCGFLTSKTTDPFEQIVVSVLAITGLIGVVKTTIIESILEQILFTSVTFTLYKPAVLIL